MIDAVYEAHSDLGMVVGHQDDVEQLLAVWIQLSEARVDVHQSLRRRGPNKRQTLRHSDLKEVTAAAKKFINILHFVDNAE